MRIGIDLSSIDKSSINQGVYTYALGLIKGFHEIDKKNFFQIYVNKDLKNHFLKKIKKKNFKIIEVEKKFIPLKKINTLISLLFGFLGINTSPIHSFLTNIINYKNKIIFEKNSDLIIFLNAHENSYNLKISSIINFHDIIHKTHPEFLEKREVIIRNVIYQNSANSADFIIASSKTMKKEFVSFMRLKVNKIILINEGVDKNFTLKVKNKKIKKKYFFYPAQFWIHKNHIQLIKEFTKFKVKTKSKIRLYLCGKRKKYFTKVEKYIKSNKIKDVIYLGELSSNELKKYYNNCEAVVMPSLYESSSLVILEAISNKKIVIASNIGPNKELSQFFKLFIFNLYRKNDLSDQLSKVVNLDEFNRKKITNHNIARIENYFWKNVAIKYKNLIDEKIVIKND